MRRPIAAALPSSLAVVTVVAVTAVARPARLAAQTEFAVPVGAGVLRINFVPEWLQYDHYFAFQTPGYADGTPVPIDLALNSDSLGVGVLPFLAPVQNELRAATGLSTFSLNLGRIVTQLNASVRTMPIGIELGLSRRLSIGVTVPIVRSRMDVNFAVDSTQPGNVVPNALRADPAAAATYTSQLDSALAALALQAASGPAALRQQAQAMITALQPFQPLATVRFVPRASTEAADSIISRLGSAEASYGQLAAQYAAQGVTLPPLTAALALADSLGMTRDDFESWISDTAGALQADTIGEVVRTGLGDVTANVTWQFAEGTRYRGQIVATWQFPTGSPPSANNPLDLGTGTHQAGLDVALSNDVFLGGSFLVHAVARGGKRFADQLMMRVAPLDLFFVPVSQRAQIRRQPGSFVGLELDPVWMMDDAFSVRATWTWFNQGGTTHSYVDPADEARVGSPASVLDAGTAASAMRIGGAVTFSTVARYAQGRASLPYSVTVGYQNTIAGSRGRVPQGSIFSILLRGYVKLF